MADDDKDKESSGDDKDQTSQDDKQDDSSQDDGEMTLEQAKELLEQTRASLSRANAESASRRKKIKELEARLGGSHKDGKSNQSSDGKGDQTGDDSLRVERDRLVQQVDQYKDRVRRSAINSAVLAAASKQGVRPDALADIPALVDHSEMEYDEETGKVTGAEDAVKNLLVQKKYLKKPAEKPPDDNSNRTGGSKGSEIDEEAVARRFGLRLPVERK